jgi:hypothetical protein
VKAFKIANGVMSLPVHVPVKELETPVTKMYHSLSASPIDTARALLEAGYGTISDVSSDHVATIDFPNLQTKNLIASEYVKINYIKTYLPEFESAVASLKKENLSGFFQFLNETHLTLPYHHAGVFDKESAWFVMLHHVFYYIGLEMSSETPNMHGRSDILAIIGQNVYILELKAIDAFETDAMEKARETATVALKQIVDKKYEESNFVRIALGKGLGCVHVAVVANNKKTRRRFEYISAVSSQGMEIAVEL